MSKTVEEYGESFAEVTGWWLEGVGKGVLISLVPILLVALGLAVMVQLTRLPLELLGGMK